MKLIKEIKSKTEELHFRRWRILKTPWFEIYIHGIYQHDLDPHLHNHPWDYMGIVLKGTYVEKTESRHNVMSPWKFFKRNGSSYHKILSIITRPVYTLFVVTKPKRIWGYLVDGKHVDHETYRKNKNSEPSK